jgi:hypothetical protein
MTVTVKLVNGDSRTHKLRHGGWVVDVNGVLHVRDGNHVIQASYAPGVWAEVQ